MTEAIHAPDCKPPTYEAPTQGTCDGTYTCPRCERTFGWCVGAYDDTPALCDDCAPEVQALWESQ